MVFSRSICTRAVLAGLVLAVSGCGVAPKTAVTTQGKELVHAQGLVHGGQQPVSGSTVQVWAAGTGGDGTAATQITASVLTDQYGGFTLPDTLSCSGTSGSTLLYLTATGGQPLTGVTNNNLAMMTAFGACSNWNSSTFISINEVTTVGAVSALAPFMSSYSAVGSAGSDITDLATAFTLAAAFADPAAGVTPGSSVPSSTTVPSALINTLANILASCINSAGGTGTNTSCGNLFSAAPSAQGASPTDTIQAILNIEQNPASNTTTLFNLVPSSAPFQNQLSSAPSTFQVLLTPSTSGASLQVGPPSLSFIANALGTAPGAQTILLVNNGSGTVSLTGMSFVGAAASTYSKTTTCGSTLAAGSGCEVTISTTSPASGTAVAYLEVDSSSSDSPHYTELQSNSFSYSGPLAAASAQTLNLGTSGETKDLTLTNYGTSALTISSIATVSGMNSLSTTCGSSLAPSAQCTISVTNGTAANGTNITSQNQLDQVMFATNDSSLAGVALNMTSTSFVSPSNVMFGPVQTGSNATTTMTFSTDPGVLSLSGTNSGDFTAATRCTVTAAAPAPCTLAVTFTPSATGSRSAQLVLADGGYVPLTGIGSSTTAPTAVTLSSSALSFANMGAPQVVTLNNTTLAPVTISSISITSGLSIPEFSQTNTCGSSLAATSSCTITVSALRATNGGDQGLLNIVTSAGTQTATLSNSMPFVIAFGPGQVTKTSAVTHSMASTAGQTYDQFQGSLSGTNASEFSTGNCSISTSGGTCSVINKFAPANTGAKTALLTMTYPANGAGTAPTVQYLLTGTGTSSTSPAISFWPSNGGTAATSYPALASGYLSIYNTGYGGSNYSYSLVGSNASAVTVGTSSGSLLNSGSEYFVSYYALNGYPSDNVHLYLPFTARVTDSVTSINFDQTIALLGKPSIFNLPAYTMLPDSPPYTIATAASIPVNPPNHDGVSTSVYSQSSLAWIVKPSCQPFEIPCTLIVDEAPPASATSSGQFQVSDSVAGAITYLIFSGYSQTQGKATMLIACSSAPCNNYGTKATGSTTTDSPYTLTNHGSLTLLLNPIALTGTNASEFSVASNTCGSTVAPGASCSFAFNFSPTISGTKTAGFTASGTDSAGTNLYQSFSFSAAAQ